MKLNINNEILLDKAITEVDNYELSIFKRQDCPFCMLVAYHKLNAVILKIIKAFKDKPVNSFSNTLKILWPHIKEIIYPVSAIALLEINYQEDEKGNKFCQNYVIEEKAKIDEGQLINNWNEIDHESKQLIISTINESTEEDVWCWNGYLKQPMICNQSKEKISIMLTLMCRLPNGKQSYLLFIREKNERPFISHEVETIRVISSIVGVFLTNAFLYKNLHATTLLK